MIIETHFQKELEELKANLLKMATLVEEAIRDAVQSMVKDGLDAFVNRDSKLARSVSKGMIWSTG